MAQSLSLGRLLSESAGVKFVRFDPKPCGFPKPLISPLPNTLIFPSPLTCRCGSTPRRETSHFRHFSRGRYALGEAYRLAGLNREAVLLAPAYHCVTMLDPAMVLKADVHLYRLQADLSPDLDALEKLLATIEKPVKALLATHYFGIAKDFSRLKALCVNRQIALIEDCSHVLFTERFCAAGTGSYGHFVVSSPYKFFACDDGGLLYMRDDRLLDCLKTVPATPIEELRGVKHAWERSRSARITIADITSIDLRLESMRACPVVLGNDEVEERSAPSPLFSVTSAHRESLRFSRLVVDHASVTDNMRRRRENYLRWLEAVTRIPNCRALFSALPAHCAPYMFPLHIAHPDPHFYWLKHLGVPMWRWDEMADSHCRVSQDYRLHLLHLPCHQALTRNQLDWMIAALDKTLNRSSAKGLQ